MDIRSDRQKGLSYVELGRKYHMDPRTAKRYAESPQKLEYTLSEPKPAKMGPYKQIALHRISYQRKYMVVNPQHYRRLILKQTMDAENVLLEQGKVIDFPLKPSDLSRYDEVLYD